MQVAQCFLFLRPIRDLKKVFLGPPSRLWLPPLPSPCLPPSRGLSTSPRSWSLARPAKQRLSTRGRKAPLFRWAFDSPGRPLALPWLGSGLRPRSWAWVFRPRDLAESGTLAVTPSGWSKTDRSPFSEHSGPTGGVGWGAENCPPHIVNSQN